MARSTVVAFLAGAGLAGAFALLPAFTAPQQDTGTRQAPPPQRPGGPGGPGGPDMGAMLVQGLKGVPGCQGVESGQWRSGRMTIAAWFTDKAAVKRWYYSEAHQRMMDMMAEGEPAPPMQHVPDDAKSILVLATLTPSDRPRLEGVPMPISQISIELYQALPGGASVGGRLAPKTFKVPHHKFLGGEAPHDEKGGEHGGRERGGEHGGG